MNTKTISQIVLKDGKSKIAGWAQEFEHRPTVGDRIRIPEDVARTLEGYDAEATVTMEQMAINTGDVLIVAEASCKLPADHRPVVTLNASLLPERIRKQVEAHVRARLDMPVLDWEESSETVPVIRFHPFKSQPKTSLDTLQRELREILTKAVALAPC
jgi:ribosomal protein L30E